MINPPAPRSSRQAIDACAVKLNTRAHGNKALPEQNGDCKRPGSIGENRFGRSDRSTLRVGSDLCSVAAKFERGRGSATYSPVPWLSAARRPPSVCHRKGGSRVAYRPANPRPAGRSLFCRTRKTLAPDTTYRHVRGPGLNLFPRRLLWRAVSARANRTEEQGISFGLVSIWPIVVRLRCGVRSGDCESPCLDSLPQVSGVRK